MKNSPSPKSNDQQRVSELKGDVELDGKAKNYADGQREPHPNAHLGVAEGSSSSPAQWTGFARWHPFTGYLQFLSDCENPKEMAPHDRFNATAKRHLILYRIAVALDFIVVLAVVSAVLFAIGFTFHSAFLNGHA